MCFDDVCLHFHEWKLTLERHKEMSHSGESNTFDNMFFTWTHVQEKLKVFWEDLNKFHPILNFISDSSKENVAFADLKVKLKQGKIETDC